MNVSFFIARRYLISKKANNAINIISWISVGAIAIGTAALVIILSFMNGLTGMVKDLYNSFDPDIEISAVKGKTFTPDSIQLQKIKNIKGVKLLDFSIEEIALLKYGDKQTSAVVKAVGPQFFKMSGLDQHIEDGTPVLKASDGYYIIMGKGVTYALSANIHDKFTPVSLFAAKKGRAAVFNPDEAFIEVKTSPSAYFSLNDEFDFKYVLVHMDVARELFEYEKEVSTIDLGLEDISYSNKVQEEIKKILGSDFYVKNRFEQNKSLFSTLESEKLVVSIVLIFVLLIATFTIIGFPIMSITEKKRDIVTLNNFGANVKLVRKIFVLESLLIILAGGLIGIALGLGFCLLQKNFELITMQALGREVPYPMKIMAGDFLLIISGVFFIGISAAWLPVRFLTKESSIEKFRLEV